MTLLAGATLLGGIGLTGWATWRAQASEQAAAEAALQARAETRLFLDWGNVDAAESHFRALTRRRARLIDLGRAHRQQAFGVLLGLAGVLALAGTTLGRSIRRELVRVEDLPALTSLRQVRSQRSRSRHLERQPATDGSRLHTTLPGTH